MDRIYQIKHRQAHIPLAICVADIKDVARFGSASHLPDGLLDATARSRDRNIEQAA